MFSNDISTLLSFACEAILWGAYCVLFAASIVILYYRFKTQHHQFSVPIFFANCLLFVSCTAHFILQFYHFYTTLGRVGVSGFANKTKPLIWADIIVSFCDLLGGLVLLYRCWIVWGRNYWVIALPLITAVVGFACIMRVAHLVLSMDPGVLSGTVPVALLPLGLAGYALPLATKFMATALLAGRLYASTCSAETYEEPFFVSGTIHAARRALEVVVESGVLYLVTQLTFVVLFAIRHPAQAILVGIAVQIDGIAPTMIIIRVALGDLSRRTTLARPFLTSIVVDSGYSGGEDHPTFVSTMIPQFTTVTDATAESPDETDSMDRRSRNSVKQLNSNLCDLALGEESAFELEDM